METVQKIKFLKNSSKVLFVLFIILMVITFVKLFILNQDASWLLLIISILSLSGMELSRKGGRNSS